MNFKQLELSTGEKIAMNVCSPDNASWCILFLHSGAIDVGKDRFKEWQLAFEADGITSVSFDFIGVGDSEGDMTQESLAKRTREAMEVTDWIVNEFAGKSFALCGVSMGGYIALDLVRQKSGVFKKLIIQVPAAYSSKAHELLFDDSFTQELRREKSWQDSPSFDWWKEYSGDKLLIACEKDQTIPREIIEKYKSIGEMSSNFHFLDIANAPHNIWRVVEDKERILEEAYRTIKEFVVSK